jgi:hypothetical protein
MMFVTAFRSCFLTEFMVNMGYTLKKAKNSLVTKSIVLHNRYRLLEF